jgi:pullulanase-like protein
MEEIYIMKKVLLICFMIMMTASLSMAAITEAFDSPSLALAYTTGAQVLGSGSWYTTDVYAEGGSLSRGGTGSAARLNDDTSGASLCTPQLSSGAGTVTYWIREYNTGGGNVETQVSTTSQTTGFSTVSTDAFSGVTFTQVTVAVNQAGTCWVRFVNDNNPGHAIIDDVVVTDAGGAPTPTPTATPVWYARGDMNGWGTDSMHDTGDVPDATADDDTFSTSISGLTASTRYEWKADDGAWGSPHPGANSLFYTDISGNVDLFFATSIDDGWAPATNRLWFDSAYVPAQVCATGDFQSQVGGADWDNNNANTLMKDDGTEDGDIAGDGIYVFNCNLSTGSYLFKACLNATWDAIGSDGLTINAGNYGFSAASPVRMYADINKMAIKVVQVAEAEVDGIGGGGKFATIREALEYLKINNAADAKVINVTTDGPITETASIDMSTSCSEGVIINGDADANGTDCTVIAADSGAANWLPATSGFASAVFFIGITDFSQFTIQDLIIMPEYISDGIYFPMGASTYNAYAICVDEVPSGSAVAPYGVTLKNIIIGGAKSGQVLAADTETNEWSVSTRFGRGLGLQSHNYPGNMNVIDISNVEVYNTHDDNFGLFVENSNLSIGPGVIGCWAGESAFYASGLNNSTMSIDGTASERNLFRGCGQDDVDEEGLFIGSAICTSLSYTDLIENGGEIDFNECVPASIDNCFFAQNDQNEDYINNCGGLRIGATNSVPTTTTVTNCTIFDDAAATNDAGIKYGYGGTDNLGLECSNVIIAGAGDIGIYGAAGAVNNVNLNYCALVMNGPDALQTATVAGDLTIKQNSVTNADPNFVSTSYTYGDDNFLAVDNGQYAGLGPASGNLTGAGKWVGTGVPVELSTFSID